ncbi:uncharacterized protein EI90DRAFT_2866553, partial [Cantharellus anzutake]|uniref:uncharacterized protein n=1 Tax=Cantharellus anzutake TaxID=1750568 RepID=UPI001908015F
LSLVGGMPVIVGENFDVEGGIVNGSQGRLKHVRYKCEDGEHRIATSAIVSIADSAPQPFANLPAHDCVILPKSVAIK